MGDMSAKTFWNTSNKAVSDLRSLGHHLIPIVGKRPMKHIVGAKHRANGDIEEWESMNGYTGMGLIMGDLVVVDVDTKRSRKQFTVEEITKKVSEALEVEETFVVATGWGNGSCHIYYSKPSGAQVNRRFMRETLDRLNFPGYDILSNKSYAVMPGSIHPQTGSKYRVHSWERVHSLPAKFTQPYKKFVPVEFPEIKLDLKPSKFLVHTEHRHRSIMSEAFYIISVADGKISLPQLIETLRIRTMNSPCAGKLTGFKSEQGQEIFLHTTCLKALEFWEPSYNTPRVLNWENSMRWLKQRNKLSDGALTLLAVLLKEFAKTSDVWVHRSYRQLAENSPLSLNRITAYRDELLAAGIVSHKTGVWVDGTYSKWRLLTPRNKRSGPPITVDLTSPAFTSRRSNGLGYSSAWVLQAANDLGSFSLKELSDECISIYGMSSNVKNTITSLVKGGLLTKMGAKLWEYHKESLDAYETSDDVELYQKDKMNRYRNQREEYEQHIDAMKAIWNPTIIKAREATKNKQKVRYVTVQTIGKRDHVPKRYWSVIHLLANRPGYKPE